MVSLFFTHINGSNVTLGGINFTYNHIIVTFGDSLNIKLVSTNVTFGYSFIFLISLDGIYRTLDSTSNVSKN